MHCRVCIWLKWKNIASFSNISIFMNWRHAHCCIVVDFFNLVGWFNIIDWFIKCVDISYVITALIDCKIVSIDPWKWIQFIEHEIVRPKYILYKSWVIHIFYHLRISTISLNWLRREVLHIYSQLKFCKVIW